MTFSLQQVALFVVEFCTVCLLIIGYSKLTKLRSKRDPYFGAFLQDELQPAMVDDVEEDMALMTDYLGGPQTSQEDDPKLTSEEIAIIHDTGADWLLEDVNIDPSEKDKTPTEVKADSSLDDLAYLSSLSTESNIEY